MLILCQVSRAWYTSSIEMFDVVDEKDNVIGQATREECHSDARLIHRAVHFTLIDKEKKKILLTQRSFKKETDPGKLTFLGEHLTSGESYKEAAIRGVGEEIGFVPSNFKEVDSHIFKLHGQTERIRFFAVSWEGEDIKIAKEEVIKREWLSPKELVRRKSDYSEMTRHWVENINWEKALSDK